MSLYSTNFKDSTEHCLYTVSIFSENGEEYQAKAVTDYTIRKIMKLIDADFNEEAEL